MIPHESPCMDADICDAVEEGRQILVLEVLPRKTEMAKVQAPDAAGYLRERLNEINGSLPPFQRVSKIVVRDTDFKRSPSMKILRKGQ